ncbi:antitoxin family protein [uncultured Thiodictyon sp.]
MYEGGVFRPLEPVEIAEHQEVSLLERGKASRSGPCTSSNSGARR